MNSRDVFETHYRSADMLLRVFRLLESEGGPKNEHELLPMFAQLLHCKPGEEMILLLNQVFLGLVREEAGVTKAFFRKDNLELLLRQSVVAACSALDVFLPHLLETYLPTVVGVRQRNFVPAKGEGKELFSDFRLRLEEIWPFVEEPDLEARWNMVAKRALDHCRGKTLSNDTGVAAVLSLLTVEGPWAAIAGRAGEKETALRDKIRKIVSRRNDIIHRADRPMLDPNGPPTPIDFVWTQNHVGAIRIVALACYDLTQEAIRRLLEPPFEPDGDAAEE